MLVKMKSLIAQLRKADATYYGKDAPIMTDLEYDKLYNELVQLEQDTGIILASSPTQRVSGEPDCGAPHQAHALGRQDQVKR